MVTNYPQQLTATADVTRDSNSGVLTRAVVVDHGRIRYDGPLAGAESPAGYGRHDHCGAPDEPPGTRYRLDQPTVTARPQRLASAKAVDAAGPWNGRCSTV